MIRTPKTDVKTKYVRALAHLVHSRINKSYPNLSLSLSLLGHGWQTCRRERARWCVFLWTMKGLQWWAYEPTFSHRATSLSPVEPTNPASHTSPGPTAGEWMTNRSKDELESKDQVLVYFSFDVFWLHVVLDKLLPSGIDCWSSVSVLCLFFLIQGSLPRVVQ